MSRRQVVSLILANIAISLVISVAVVTVALDRWEAGRPVYPTLAMPAREATATPLASDSMYIVQQGDSLSSIAYRFDVAIEDLMEANEITDPDHITVGRRLIIPSGSAPASQTTPTHTVLPFEPPTPVSTFTDTPAATATETTATASVTPTATLETPAGAPSVQIESITGAGDLAKEALLLRNAGDTPISLDGWIVTDDVVHEYQFGDISLEPGGEIALHTGAGEDVTSDVYWNLDTALWKIGVTATLLDRDGEVIHKLSVE